MSGVNEIRSAFLDYFAKNGHEVVPSSPLVPRNDPTLMFTNAGMVQFKNVFTGHEKRPYSRAATAQKCVRAGGKHNDLDNVGYTARHHTFFEMLGNFSFGDYFKERAIELAWNLITKEFGLPKDGCLVTVYHTTMRPPTCGRRSPGFPDRKIIRIPTSDNFWQMGDTGPCGPCSEIFIDQGDKLAGGPPGSPDEDGDRFLEFWNLVFMQYEQIEPGNRDRPAEDRRSTPAWGWSAWPRSCRACTSNYDTDLFRTLIEAVAHATGVAPEGERKASHRVIADHLRASSFLVADGVLPSNEGRGYVLRRIMRRAMRHAQLLGAQGPADVPARAGARARDGPGLSGAHPRRAAHHRNAAAGGNPLPQDPGARPRPSSTRRPAASTKGRSSRARWPSRSTTPTASPSTSRRMRCKPRGIGVDTDGFDAAMERQREKARAGVVGLGRGRDRGRLVRHPRARRRDRVPRLRHRDRRGHRAGAAEGRQRGGGARRPARPASWCSTRRRSTASPAARSATPASCGARARACASPAPRRSSATSSCTMSRRGARPPEAGPVARARRRSRAPLAPCAPTTRRPICCTRRCARCSATTSPRRARWSPPTGCASTSAIRSRSTTTSSRGSRTIANAVAAPERAGGHQAHGGRRGDRVRRAGAVRREIRRRGPRGLAWARRDGQAGSLLGRALRRHPCGPHRRHRPRHHRRRERGGGRRAPPRGA